ncbi:hypothetical protein Gocc_2092 [Gaiella occulta]|uniref:Uncharacterized protein n=1 Tax=Gaiella occulta TaxID=1002870 RepID=A0A7M2YVE8_9ACTN|nr:hypothetical protein [Gaiella occulta]RDI73995.1 hypothetical protein Gocc_2092 [Gaiella occulta]
MEEATGTRGPYRMPSLGRLAPALAVLALFLVPWAFWLSRTLPATHTARHWDLAWAGFDVALAFGLASTALSAVRHSPWLAAAASATGTLLVVDAWFDVLTAQGGSELALAAAEAVLVELPLAALSFWIVRDAERAIETLCDCLRIRRDAPKRAAVPVRPAVRHGR